MRHCMGISAKRPCIGQSSERIRFTGETKEKVKVIREFLKAASDRQKSYSDLKQKEIEFQVGDKVITMKKSPQIWLERQVESTLYQAIRNYREDRTDSLSFGLAA
ncbi:beta-amylase 1, chloroplastic-like [Gossypium australe]|uniref:Beta-amylase 1, chloroplastic-like n=1 Tax=Gossypium australe TaxID=47621 RepID=A0A5B6X3V0_9ROSI|nr:beta-amylase 1, chloroplastic-like [Gossypium australe]